MTLPRRLLPGAVHFATRRTSRRQFLLLPEKPINEIVLYAIARAAFLNPTAKVHALFVSTTHHHIATTDALHSPSKLPKLLGSFHSLSARALNAHYGRGENFWCPGSYSNAEVRARLDLEEQLLYAWTQPVKDGLVATPEEWPGIRFLPEDLGTEILVKKPAAAFFGGRRPQDWEPTDPKARRQHRKKKRRQGRHFLRTNKARRRAGLEEVPLPKTRPPRPSRSRLPDEIKLKISVPPGYEGWHVEDVRAHFRQLLDQRLAEIHAQRAALRLPYMGLPYLLAQSPFAASGPTAPTFALDPRIAAKDPHHRIHLLQALQHWRREYRTAWKLWTQGNREVVFPAGTYAMGHLHGAQVANTEPIKLLL